MERNRKLCLHLIDIVGACILIGALGVFVWLTTVRSGQSAAELDSLKGQIQAAQQDVGTLRAARDRQRAVLADRQAQLAKTGRLPLDTPIEEYFQTLSRIAAQHQLRVIRHNPLTPRRYPGLLEHRYAYELTGSTPDLLRFLKWIEDSDFWADVSYLTVDRGPGPKDAPSNGRVARLAISLFSALPSDTPSPGGDG